MTTAAVVLVVLLFLTKPLQYLPNCVLSSVVFLIGIELVDLVGTKKILRTGHTIEFAIATVTAVTVVAWGVEQGIILAIILSILAHLRRSYSPSPTARAAAPTRRGARSRPTPRIRRRSRGWRSARASARASTYANASHFREELLALAAADRRRAGLADAIGDIGYDGSATPGRRRTRAASRLFCAAWIDPVRAELAIDALLDAIGPEHVFETINAVQTAHRNHRRGADN